eukprot:3525411-Rhodomonas_salina.1
MQAPPDLYLGISAVGAAPESKKHASSTSHTPGLLRRPTAISGLCRAISRQWHAIAGMKRGDRRGGKRGGGGEEERKGVGPGSQHREQAVEHVRAEALGLQRLLATVRGLRATVRGLLAT